MNEAELCPLMDGFADRRRPLAGGDGRIADALDVLVTDASGAQREPITFDVVDTEMREAIVKGFGADLARIMAQDAASGG